MVVLGAGDIHEHVLVAGGAAVAAGVALVAVGGCLGGKIYYDLIVVRAARMALLSTRTRAA